MKKGLQITLIITEDCCLNCSYCYEIHKTEHKMTFEKAKKHIDKEMKNISDNDEINIEFFGGEPFLNFELIKQVVSYVTETYPNKMVTYNTTTNGVILSPDIKKWLWNHRRHFYTSLSLDGTKYNNDKNRVFKQNGEGTFDYIDQEFFLKTYKPASVKATIAPNCLDCMSESIIYLMERGFEVDATLAMGNIDWSNSVNVKILTRELNKLIEYYAKNPERKTIRMLEVPFDALFSEKKENTRFCGAGVRIHCYTGSDDYWTPCQGFSKITVGEEISKQYAEESFENYVEPDIICKRCPLTTVCCRCWGTNLAATGSIDIPDPWLCVINRVLLLAGSRIAYDRIFGIQKNEWTKKEVRILKAISIITENAFNTDIVYLSDSLDD